MKGERARIVGRKGKGWREEGRMKKRRVKDGRRKEWVGE